MDAMTILRRCRAADGEIKRLEIRIRQRYDVLTAIGAPQADPNGGSHGGGDRDRMGSVMAGIDLLERELQKRQERLNAERVAALSLLDMLSDLESRVLYLYYLSGMDTPAIARKEKYTTGYVRKVKRSGEQLAGMLMEERVESALPAWYLKEEEEHA